VLAIDLVLILLPVPACVLAAFVPEHIRHAHLHRDHTLRLTRRIRRMPKHLGENVVKLEFRGSEKFVSLRVGPGSFAWLRLLIRFREDGPAFLGREHGNDHAREDNKAENDSDENVQHLSRIRRASTSHKYRNSCSLSPRG